MLGPSPSILLDKNLGLVAVEAFCTDIVRRCDPVGCTLSLKRRDWLKVRNLQLTRHWSHGYILGVSIRFTSEIRGNY